MDLIDDPGSDPRPRPGSNLPEYTVGELSGAVKRALEDEFGRVRVRGEVGRVVRARSGHLYFDVKDDRNVLNCTSWKGQVAKLSVIPEEGMEVVVTGKLSAYGPQSRYNLNVDDVAVAGAGALMAMLEKRRATLAAEGLFDAGTKRPLPFLPEVIGVVTSPTGAVIRDILHRLRDRFPRRVLVWPVAVQGPDCARQVAAAIRGFDAMTPGGALPRPDVVIVARGGGSIEDLWGFNEEVVVRAAHGCRIPLISAVGHETDTTLIDHAADRRAPTPTAAAEMAVPVRRELLAWSADQGARLERGLARAFERRRQRLSDLSRGLRRPEALLDAPRQRLDRADEALARVGRELVARRRVEVAEAAQGLHPRVLRGRMAARAERAAGLAARLRPGLRRNLGDAADRLGRRAEGLAARSPRARLVVSRQRLGRAADRLPLLPRRVRERAAGRLAVAVPGLRIAPLRRRMAQARGDLAEAGAAVGARAAGRLDAARARLRRAGDLHETLSYRRTLERGYAVLRGDGAVVSTVAGAKAATALEVELADGRLPLGGTPKASRPTKRRPEPEQGDLF
ncbi:MAG: exodeoxyribonuclease VII large subunit [Paracoccaceae bacterium]